MTDVRAELSDIGYDLNTIHSLVSGLVGTSYENLLSFPLTLDLITSYYEIMYSSDEVFILSIVLHCNFDCPRQEDMLNQQDLKQYLSLFLAWCVFLMNRHFLLHLVSLIYVCRSFRGQLPLQNNCN